MRLCGLDAAALDDLRKSQSGHPCRERPAEHVDHDHVTKRVRALLWFRCDTGLGQSDARPDLVRRAADDVETFGAGHVRVATGVHRVVRSGAAPASDLGPLLAGRHEP